MSQVIITANALLGLEKCRKFLSNKNSIAAGRAASVISKSFNVLKSNPEIGRAFDEAANLRELIIDFGATGYVALYRYDETKDIVVILAFRHQREAGY